jgi:hypothetical protein
VIPGQFNNSGIIIVGGVHAAVQGSKLAASAGE